MSNEEDWAFARALSADYQRLNFRGLLERYYEIAGDIPTDRRASQVAHIVSAPARSRHHLAALGLGPTERSPLLDLGCGPGGFLVEASETFGEQPLWGVDVGLRWLLLARKRLDELGLQHVRLACACAEALPFRDASFVGIVATDVIEHVADQPATLAEAHRVLRPSGRILLTTPNRYSLTPEPHVGVLGVGYLPRRWMGPYVRMCRGLDYRAIRNRGWRDWDSLLRASPFGGASVDCPRLPNSEVVRFPPWKRLAARLYNRAVSTRPGQALARAVGPLFQIIAVRAEPSEHPARPLAEAPADQQDQGERQTRDEPTPQPTLAEQGRDEASDLNR
jgi:SAM-dependent methyltransferase